MSKTNEDNYQFITETIFPRFGIPQSLEPELLKQMKDGSNTIVLGAAGTNGKDTMEFSFKFELNPKDERYYLNSIQANLTKEDGESRAHNFRIFNQRGHDIDAMSKILNEKFVYTQTQKEGKDYNHWMTINPSQKDEQGNNLVRKYYDNTTKFNLVLELSKLPLAYMNQDDKEKLLQEMRQGDGGRTSIKKPDGSRERVTLFPRPDIGQIHVFNKDGERLRLTEEKVQAVTDGKFILKGNGSDQKVSPAVTALVTKGQDGTGQGDEKKQGRKAS